MDRNGLHVVIDVSMFWLRVYMSARILASLTGCDGIKAMRIFYLFCFQAKATDQCCRDWVYANGK